VIGEFLYRLNPRDAQFPQLVHGVANVLDQGNKTPCSCLIFPGSQDQILVPLSFSFFVSPGAGQTVFRVLFYARDPVTPSRTFNIAIKDYITPAAGQTSVESFDTPSDVIVPAGWQVVANADFSGIVASNQLSVDCSYLLLPRGNLTIP